MSVRLLKLWVDKHEVNHTPIDDLESFAWVLLYNALAWTPANLRTSDEARWWSNLNTNIPVLLLEYKRGAILFDWAPDHEHHEAIEMTIILQKFRTLISAGSPRPRSTVGCLQDIRGTTGSQTSTPSCLRTLIENWCALLCQNAISCQMFPLTRW
ncbi:hypothetical protein HGRIS_014224 [Hohenbuehelia grisea]|uniref:Fungal-type protein kinase domain-containing protein n=1 Tax=Hohenbuehelia grisea TaxID=104357 RepID=A0ABR3JSX1_9AGAR